MAVFGAAVRNDDTTTDNSAMSGGNTTQDTLMAPKDGTNPEDPDVPGDNTTQDTPIVPGGDTAPDETKLPSDEDESEVDASVRIDITVPDGVLKVGETFRKGSITLTASVGEITAEAASTYVELKEATAPSEALGEIEDYMEEFKRSVVWVDNNNEDGIRLSTKALEEAAASGITFTVNGETYPLNEENIRYLNMTELPMPQVVADGVNAYTLIYPENTFPTLLSSKPEGEDEEPVKYPVTWNIVPPAHAGYDPVEVKKENIENYPSLQDRGDDAYGWYYILKTSVTFDVVLNTGASYNESGNFLNPDLRDAVLSHFALRIERPGHSIVDWKLNEITEGALQFLPQKGGTSEDASSDEYKTAKIIIEGGWKYNINGAQMIYSLVRPVPEGTAEAEPIIAPAIPTGDAPVGVGEDQLAVTYDNTGTAYNTEKNATYPGGKLYLTLTGEAKYDAKKVWEDQGVSDLKRPDAVLELWRYRNGEDFQSATPVRDSEDNIIQVKLAGDAKSGVPIEISFVAEEIKNLDSLPKYDSDGFRYVYVVKEYLSGTNANQYKQVFGSITESAPGSGQFTVTDTLPSWLTEIPGTTTARAENNYYLYNGGTLSNCVNVDTKVAATKTWKAASFQADFKNVIVELTLQSRPKMGEDQWGEWSAAQDKDRNEIKRIKYGFGEEELTAWNVEATVPKYGLLGRELEYQWVESAVYQAPAGADTPEELQTWYENKKKEGLLDEENLLEDGKFVLDQNDRKVSYRSVDSPVVDGFQTITNELEDTVDYTVIKKWEGVDPQEVRFSLFRIPSGGKLEGATQAYMSFAMDATGKVVEPFQKPDDAPGVTVENLSDWTVQVKNLPEFDGNGAAYQYLLLEEKGEHWVPEYDTKRVNGDYNTTVTNGTGTGNRIMVRKEWVDNSDVTHRDPVTIQVWERKSEGGPDQLLNEVELDGSQEWNQLVETSGVNPENIYIKEVRAGGSTVEYETGANWNDAESVTGRYASRYHNYEVTYLPMQNILGEWVFTVRNRRVNTINLTVNKLWKDNNGMLRKELAPALEELDSEVTLSLQLQFAGEDVEGYAITNDTENGGAVTVGEGMRPQPVQDNLGNPVASVQPVKFGKDDSWPNESSYYFFNLPKYDNTGAVVHYTIKEVWLDKDGSEIEELAEYLEIHLEGYPDAYPDLAQMLKEYSFAITDQSYQVGESADGGKEAAADLLASYARDGAIVPDQQAIELTNRLSGTKTVYWHKLWDDYYPYSLGKRPDIYLDIFRLVHKEEDGELVQIVEPYYRDYRWDSSADSKEQGVISDQGNPKTHWHVVLENLPKYDEETGREYYYYAVERTKVNIKQLDYADVTFYVAKEGSRSEMGDPGDVTNVEWPDNGVEDLQKIGTARITEENEHPIEEEYLKFGYNDPAEAYRVPENLKGVVPSFKHYQYPDYMLLEGGYFSNALTENVTIEGRKLWQGIPNSYPKLDLPAIKFNVYRSLATGIDASPMAGEKEFVASLTVEKWADAYKDGTYQFTIDHYTDKDGNPTKEDGTIVTDAAFADKLPKYDEDGRLYAYSLVEDTIYWPGGTETKVPEEDNPGEDDLRKGIFNTTQPGVKNFVATNAYNGVKGSLSVKKILKLETKKTFNWDGTVSEEREYVYPAVKFTLTRSYISYQENENGKLVPDTSFSQEKIWTEADVRKAHLEQGGDKDQVYGIITFTNLEKYAPNGSEYQYTITEDTGYLSGYGTLVAEGEQPDANGVKEKGTETVSFQGLTVTAAAALSDGETPEPGATFLNEFKGEEQEKYPMVLQKVWRDYDDIFKLRPEIIQVEITRYAESQPGQGNGIREKFATVTLPTDPAYKSQFGIEFADGISGYGAETVECEMGNAWVWINSEEHNEAGWRWVLRKFERYAPNGMPWIYIVEERAGDAIAPYTLKESGWSYWNNDPVLPGGENEGNWRMPGLVNSIYTDASFSKVWKDSSGQVITEDYLKKDLTVTFQLQVKEENGSWADADEYFGENLDEAAIAAIKKQIQSAVAKAGLPGSYDLDKFVATLSGRVNETAKWSGKFPDLPACIKKVGNDDITNLAYRVVETSVQYDNTQQLVTVEETGTYTMEGTDTGLVESAAFTPEGNVTANTLKTTSLTVVKVWSNYSYNQYGTRPAKAPGSPIWETVFVIQRSVDDGSTWENVTKVVLNGESVDLYKYDSVAGLPLVDPNGKMYTYRARELEPGTDEVVENNSDYYGGYTATYRESERGCIATNVLKSGKVYRNYAAEKNWYPEEAPAGETRSVTFALQYLKGDDAHNQWWETLARVTLNGEQDTGLLQGDGSDKPTDMAYGEDSPWHAVWKNVPLYYKDSFRANEDDTTTYRVVETSHEPEEYLVQSPTEAELDQENQAYSFKFVNIQPTSLKVEKRWIGAEKGELKDVVVGLYRTASPANVGNDDDRLAVKDQEGNPLTLTLTAGNGWKGTFENLPAYYSRTGRYYYYAVEKTVDGKAPAEMGFGAVHQTEDGVTTITNTPTTTVTGTKTWLDDGNKKEKRPEDLKLVLERQAGGTGDWEKLEKAEPTWEKEGDVWTYTYDGLPKVDPSGLTYTYQVSEVLPQGYIQGISGQSNSLINILTGKTGFTVTKVWADNNGEGRPESLQLTLYRSTEGMGAEDGEAVQAEPVLSQEGNQWVYTYSELEQYDQKGVEYTYWVEETVPEGYDAQSKTAGDGGVLENIRQGGLKITKTVSGNRGETDRKFHFTVTLLGTSTAGVEPGSVAGKLTVYQGETVQQQSDAAFTEGKAEFTLTHGQWAEITGLPAGMGYKVEETEANREGYTTVVREISGATVSGAAASGLIVPGGQAEIAFQNDRHESLTPGGTVTVEGTKTWVDNDDAAGRRPAQLELILYRSIDGEEQPVSATPTWDKNGSVWTYRYEDLPERVDGKLCVYRVEEVVPEGYTAHYEGNSMVNTLDEEIPLGGLKVLKIVFGAPEDLGTRFHFTVMLSDTGINGAYGGMTFQNGVAAFTLRHGESVTADGLPSGISYVVTETESNQNGYTTGSIRTVGTITPETALAAFVNRKDDYEGPLDPNFPSIPDFPDDPELWELLDEMVPLEGWDMPGDEQDVSGILDHVPQMGDTSRLSLWLILSLFSLGVLLLLIGSGRHKKKKSDKEG